MRGVEWLWCWLVGTPVRFLSGSRLASLSRTGPWCWRVGGLLVDAANMHAWLFLLGMLGEGEEGGLGRGSQGGVVEAWASRCGGVDGRGGDFPGGSAGAGGSALPPASALRDAPTSLHMLSCRGMAA